MDTSNVKKNVSIEVDIHKNKTRTCVNAASLYRDRPKSVGNFGHLRSSQQDASWMVKFN